LGTSGASVRLELANGQFYNYTPPTTASYLGANDVWTVFELTVNTNGTMSIATVNTVQSNTTDVNVRSVGTDTPAPQPPVMGQSENMLWFSKLPVKP
jgi:hypothetical protein